jgi:hypothetical protein
MSDQNPVSKKIKSNTISFSNIKNFIKNDCIVDLIKKKCSEKPPVDSFDEWLFNEGYKHEENIINHIDKNIHKVVYVDNVISQESCNRAENFINEKIPILASVPFCDDKYKGIIDLLVRSDYIHLLNDKIPIDSEEPYYIVIDIKSTKLKFSNKEIPYLNNSADLKAWKAQLCFYNNWINRFCNVNYQKSYLIFGKDTVENCLLNIGFVDFEKKDKSIPQLLEKGIEWVNFINTNHKTIDLYNHRIPELFPNMCVNSYNYNKIKGEIAHKIREITQIWKVNITHRNNAMKQNIYSWDDPLLNSKILGIKNQKHAKIIDNIIKVNRDSDTIIWKNDGVMPFSVYKDEANMFLDIETVDNIIFMLGIYVKENCKWKYKVFLTTDIKKPDEEKRIMNEFYIEYKRLNKPNIFFWAADENIWKQASKRNNVDFGAIKWINMTSVFIDYEIAIKGCFNFGLKQVASAMQKLNMISRLNDGDCSSGKDAIIQAKMLYKEKSENKKWQQLINVIDYNEFDCEVLFEIFDYFIKLL